MIKRAATATAAVLTVFALAGCGFIQEKVEDKIGDVVEEGVERAIENGASGDVDVQFGDDAQLPAGFPGEVPVPDATITGGVGTEEGWWVAFASDDPNELDDLWAKYDAQGWELTNENITSDYAQRQYRKGRLDVVVGAVLSDPENVQLTVAVTVIPE